MGYVGSLYLQREQLKKRPAKKYSSGHQIIFKELLILQLR